MHRRVGEAFALTIRAAGPAELTRACRVRYLPADVDEQVAGVADARSAVDSIAYDDSARTGAGFSFAQVNEAMDSHRCTSARSSPGMCFGEVLKDSRSSLVSAMYEFHAPHIKDAHRGIGWTTAARSMLVLDNATFAQGSDDQRTIRPRARVFEDWATDFAQFRRIVAPEGTRGLISDAYHIKVTVRDDDTFWLSSGNWKSGLEPAGHHRGAARQRRRRGPSRQSRMARRDQEQDAGDRFRNHILQDFKRIAMTSAAARCRAARCATRPSSTCRSRRRRARGAAAAEQPASEPRTIFSRTKVKVKPLLTPDQEGARLFGGGARPDPLGPQQPAVPDSLHRHAANPRQDRGFIDELIRALTRS